MTARDILRPVGANIRSGKPPCRAQCAFDDRRLSSGLSATGTNQAVKQLVKKEENKMNLQKLFFMENACYKAGRKITVKGIMVHSTGANNPWLKRYVGPDDGKLGKNQYNNHWNTYHPGGREVCVHGFIGKLADGSVATYQTLP